MTQPEPFTKEFFQQTGSRGGKKSVAERAKTTDIKEHMAMMRRKRAEKRLQELRTELTPSS
jgi:hypothetical protein